MLHKIEKNLRPVAKPILEDAARVAILKGLNGIGLGKRSAGEVGLGNYVRFFNWDNGLKDNAGEDWCATQLYYTIIQTLKSVALQALYDDRYLISLAVDFSMI